MLRTKELIFPQKLFLLLLKIAIHLSRRIYPFAAKKLPKQSAPAADLWGLLAVLVHPVQDLVHTAHAVLRLAAAGELVVLALEQAQLGLAIGLLQCSEHAQALNHPAAEIVV